MLCLYILTLILLFDVNCQGPPGMQGTVGDRGTAGGPGLKGQKGEPASVAAAFKAGEGFSLYAYSC